MTRIHDILLRHVSSLTKDSQPNPPVNAPAIPLNPPLQTPAWTLPVRNAGNKKSFAPSNGAVALRPGAAVGLMLVHALAIWGFLHLDSLRQTVMQRAPLIVSILTSSPAATLASPRGVSTARPAPRREVPPAMQPPPTAERGAPSPVSAFSVGMAAADAARPTAVVTAPDPTVTSAPSSARSAPAPALTAPPSPPTAPTVPKLIPPSAVQTLEPLLADYPKASRRNAEAGTVTVRAYIDSEGGAPRSVQIEHSSGFFRLDQAALAAVQRARFKPYTDNGRPVEGWALIPFVFELEK